MPNNINKIIVGRSRDQPFSQLLDNNRELTNTFHYEVNTVWATNYHCALFTIPHKNAFQYDAYHPLQWPPLDVSTMGYMGMGKLCRELDINSSESVRNQLKTVVASFFFD